MQNSHLSSCFDLVLWFSDELTHSPHPANLFPLACLTIQAWKRWIFFMDLVGTPRQERKKTRWKRNISIIKYIKFNERHSRVVLFPKEIKPIYSPDFLIFHSYCLRVLYEYYLSWTGSKCTLYPLLLPMLLVNFIQNNIRETEKQFFVYIQFISYNSAATQNQELWSYRYRI